MVMKGFAAGRALIRHLEEGPEHLTRVAIRAAAAKPAPDRLPGQSCRQSTLPAAGGGGGGRRRLRGIVPTHRPGLRLRAASRPEAPPLAPSLAPSWRRDLRADAPRCPFPGMPAAAPRRPPHTTPKPPPP